MSALFGPAGNSESFATMGYKKTEQIPEYITAMGLTAYEYQCGRGVRISTPSAEKLGQLAKEKKIALSVHAPYYISLSSVEEEKRIGSVGYILETARAAKDMGAPRIIVHTGSCGKMSREAALALAKDTMQKAYIAMDEQGYADIHICPETMGKVNQLGTLEEVVELCTIDERLIPCIDFGHLNARTFGGLKSYDDFKAIFDLIENKLGNERLKNFHSHFSKIEYTMNGGEKKHLTFEDSMYGPEFNYVAELTAKKGLSPIFICESAGTQAEDAKVMMEMYFSAIGKGNLT
ncbi:MAG: TIM barrel protein [Oscillospiraceae bacterium]